MLDPWERSQWLASKPDVIYIGTGEPQLRDCVSWGDGVYKSTDGGDTWKHMGLE